MQPAYWAGKSVGRHVKQIYFVGLKKKKKRMVNMVKKG